jgi:hypothetical protein
MSCDDFQGTETVLVQPNDNGIPYTYTVLVQSATGLKDGSLPFGSVISSVTVTAFDDEDVDQTTSLIVGTPSLAINVVQIKFKWPDKEGIFKLRLTVTLTGGETKEYDFLRVEARDQK